MRNAFLIFIAAMMFMFQTGAAVSAGEKMQTLESDSKEEELDLNTMTDETPRAPAKGKAPNFGLINDETMEFEVNPENLEY